MICLKLAQFSRTINHMSPLGNTTVSAGGIIEVDLPNNTIIDLSTFQFFFQGISSSTTGYTRFFNDIETIYHQGGLLRNSIGKFQV